MVRATLPLTRDSVCSKHLDDLLLKSESGLKESVSTNFCLLINLGGAFDCYISIRAGSVAYASPSNMYAYIFLLKRNQLKFLLAKLFHAVSIMGLTLNF